MLERPNTPSGQPVHRGRMENSLVDAVFHLFNCDSASSLDGFICFGKPAVSNHNLLVRKTL
jgi:hypothetical protein